MFFAFLMIVLFGLNVYANDMRFPMDSWETGSPESQNIDSEQLNTALQYLKEAAGNDGIEQVVVIRNGVMVWEGDRIDEVHGVWSMTKSFTSTCLGLLIDEGRGSLDTLAHEYVPEMEEDYPTLTLKHFTTMTSGYRAEGDTTSGSYTHGPSSTPFEPAEPLFTPPGSQYAYWDSAMNQFANVLTQIAEEPLIGYFERKIADTIQMDSDGWNWGDFGRVDGIRVNGGAGNNGNHIRICAREAARFGHLFLNQGNWDGEQLISKQWVKQACQTQVGAEVPMADRELSSAEGSGVYGFNWWCNGTKADGTRKWPGAPVDAYSASGFNNNDMFVIPSWNMVFVRLGLDQGDDKIEDEEYGRFFELLGVAIREE